MTFSRTHLSATTFGVALLCGSVASLPTSASAASRHHKTKREHHTAHRHRTAERRTRVARRSQETSSDSKLNAAINATACTGSPQGEVRAMWIVCDSLQSPGKILNAIAMAKKNNFNTLFVQVRSRGDAYYNSNVEPRAEGLASQPASFDPLQFTIENAHKAGLEVHAWLCTFLVWSKSRHPYSSEHIINRHSEWLVQDKDANINLTERSDSEGAFLDPVRPEVREYTKQVFMDVVNHYDIDGIHFDYVRFPSNNYSFARYDLAAFRYWMRPHVSDADAAFADAKALHNRLAWYYCYPEQWKAWRREVVMDTVKSIADETHRVKPNVIVSAAVFPNYQVASQDKGQDWHTWLADGLLDAACPMTYNVRTEVVGAQIRDAVANSCGRPIVAGVGAWQLPAQSAIAKGVVYRQLGACGINVFSYGDVTRDGKTDAYLSRFGQTLFSTPAQKPDWRRVAPVAPPAGEVIPASAPTAAPAQSSATIRTDSSAETIAGR